MRRVKEEWNRLGGNFISREVCVSRKIKEEKAEEEMNGGMRKFGR